MSDAPPKFIKDPSTGVRKLNPEFKTWQAKQGGGAAATAASTANTMKNEAVALPVVCNMQDFSQLGHDAQVNAAFQAAQQQYLQTAQQVGMTQETMMDKLGKVFAKYEIPMGLLNMLMALTEFSVMECLLDDSGSMGAATDSKRPDGTYMTRWEEAKKNVEMMIEVLAYVNFPPMHLVFLNRPDDIVLQRNPGESPEQFLPRAHALINQAFARGPSGTTPYLERARQSLARYPGQAVLRYFFGDGTPNGGEESVEQIKKLVKNRPNPQKNPITFVACTNNDEDVEWMSSVEECAPFCSASDDYGDESAEVLKDQGPAFPYSKGMWLLSLIIGALYPDSLDAIDESAPLPRATMSQLAGYELSTQEYDYYLNGFFDAQRKKPAPRETEDKIKAEYAKKFEAIRNEFHKAPTMSSIPLVQEYRKKMMESSSSGCVVA